MKNQARVVVIGGGVVGCSVLYHLTKLGWRDVMLLERDELTCGSTWHAAGGMHTLNGDPNVAKLQQYTIELYREIEEISGQSCGVHLTGGVMLADTPERMDWLRMAHARGRYLGMETEIISVGEARARMPLLDESHFVGALWDPIEGHLDPSGVTHAYAKAARAGGAEVHRQTKVEDLTPRGDGSWDVHTGQGTIHAEHVVNAGGLWARECGRMVGLELPVLAMEHMYVLTEDMPEVKAMNEAAGHELPHAIDFAAEIYMRQERGGMLVGTYERACKPWSPRETPWDFGHELLEPDLDRITPSLEVGFRHFPALGNAGLKQIINGPFTFAPDGNPLVGPIRGLGNYWVACGVMAGFSQGGGVGLALANWMVEGDPGFDIWGMDVSRYGNWATMAYTNAKVRENYSRRFRIRFPNEELPAGRPVKTTPLYDRLLEKGAVMGDSWGLESALWFAPSRAEAKDVFSFRRSTDFEHVGAECRAVREAAGITETANFAKYEVSGPGAEGWLLRLLAGKIPEPGRMALSPMLNARGKIIGDFSVANLGGERFFIVGSGAAEAYHMRWFKRHLPADGSVALEALGLDLVGLSIAGPRSRDLLSRVAMDDVSAEAFRFMDMREMDVGPVPCRVGRVSFTGDLGYEIWCRPQYLRALYGLLSREGEALGLGDFGGRALNSLRLEKGFGTWAREYRPIYGPVETGLERFVDWSRNADFIGRAAAQEEKQGGGKVRLRTFVVDAGDADVMGDEPIWRNGEVHGWVTSGGYAHASGRSVALGYVPKEMADIEDGWKIEILGEAHAARLQQTALFDPDGKRMRG